MPDIPRRAVFVASADHNTVSRYVLEIFREGEDPSRQTPLLTRDLGVPPVVNGECTVDIASAMASMGAGMYFATVSAENAAGRQRSSPSGLFSIP